MSLAWQIATARRLMEHVESGSTDLAPGLRWVVTGKYFDPDVWTTEMEVVRLGPFCVGLSCELPTAASFKSAEVLGVSILQSRDMHAFFNVRRHVHRPRWSGMPPEVQTK
jgi:hypothetical protein